MYVGNLLCELEQPYFGIYVRFVTCGDCFEVKHTGWLKKVSCCTVIDISMARQ